MRVVALISGRGSNLVALLHAERLQRHASIVAVVSNEPSAAGLQRAEEAGVPTAVVCHRDYGSREAFGAALLGAVLEHAPDVVVLAGFMRILPAAFITALDGRLLNIHPSLLPKYPGLDTHRRAIDAGDSEHGATVHFVTPDLDAGPAIVQARVPIFNDDDADALAARVLEREHIIYALALEWFTRGRVQLAADRVLLDGEALAQPIDLDEWLARCGAA